MADEQYMYSAVYYPKAVAQIRFALGLPAGWISQDSPHVENGDVTLERLKRSDDFFDENYDD